MRPDRSYFAAPLEPAPPAAAAPGLALALGPAPPPAVPGALAFGAMLMPVVWPWCFLCFADAGAAAKLRAVATITAIASDFGMVFSLTEPFEGPNFRHVCWFRWNGSRDGGVFGFYHRYFP